MGIKKGKNSANPDLPCLDRHSNPMTSSLCKKRKQEIIANCGDETNWLIELLAVMTENEAAHDSRVKKYCNSRQLMIGICNLTGCLDTKLWGL